VVGIVRREEDSLPQHRLRAHPSAIAEARRRVRDRLEGLLDPERLVEAQLLASELVTNAVLHADMGEEAEIELDFEVAERSVRVSVADTGRGFDLEKIFPGSMDVPGGWGLFLVEALADRWGIDVTPPHRVWFEIDR
jgi:anti-sigma regulatory factor (Ser/Thr protein kinase)